ncbi:hypothetical protein PLICRDRAFT_52136 [Plicaturopsis crispa FD-325 SS-3]|nr:hypothetical protein PLICRDRAFT_52136 [Plicaturopsis crispa FD-325 SS-3]
MAFEWDAYDALLHHVFKQTQGDSWFKPSEENVSGGVCLRADTGQFRVFPYENPFLAPFEAAVRVLNPVVAVKIRSASVHAALATVAEDAPAIYVDANTRIQIVDSMSLLPRAEKEQCGAFIRDERVLVCWSDDLDAIIPLCHEFEEKLIKLVWRARVPVGRSATATFSRTPSALDLDEKTQAVDNAAMVLEKERSAPKPKDGSLWPSKWSWKLMKAKNTEAGKQGDLEYGGARKSARPIRLFAPFYGGFGAALAVFFIGSGINVLLQESKLDGSFTRLALIATTPFLFCVSLFFALQVVTNVSYVLGPVAQYHENSRYYSAVKPVPNVDVDSALPHITIEMPVYKESLEQTIAPSVFSLKKAMQTYARQGGTSAIFVHDDGLQLISEDEREARIAFYANHNIGWVARPGHSSSPDGFKRAGRFKKASNMNYGLALSLKMEKHIIALEAEEQAARARGEDVEDTDDLEDRAVALAVEETYEESGRKFLPWACNGKSLRVGEIILLVDSDTIVPEDCFRDAARELAECPEVSVLQHESDVMQVAHHYFENGISHFTRRINKCISMGCANGEIAPFVGHNAFLRWSAIQEAAFIDADDGVKKIWSESNVSEDFDMALRLQLKGYIIRWATYSDRGFKEGVSLTVDDELNRWQKYAYGCNELIFNPLIHWWKLGPITKQLRTFLWTKVPVHYKLSMMSYGIAASAVLSVLNYVLLGFAVDVDGFYMHSFEIWLACTVVFPGAGNLGFTMLEYRLGHRSIWASLKENVTWIPFFFFFFGGLSIHLSIALLAHLFSYDISWSATKKEVERSNFFIEVPRILKRFWLAFTLSFMAILGMIILTTSLVPPSWQIPGVYWAIILPLSIVAGGHIVFPIILNPWLMIFSY